MADILKALTEGTDSAGGFTVPEILSNEILGYIQAQSVAIPDQQRVVMTSDELRLPKLTNGSTARWPATEAATITGADIAFGRTTISAKKVAALLTVSSELLEDSPAAVASIVAEQMGKDMALAIDAAIIGTGGTLATVGLGYTGSANNISCGTLSWQALVSAGNAVVSDNHEQPDTMYINPANVLKLQLLTDSSARPIFNMETWGSPLLKEGVIGTVLGMKVKPTTQLTTSSIICGVSGKMGYYGVRRNMQFFKDYQISTDAYILQSNMRVGWNVKYGDAFCVLREVA
jgi:HK97 family phage major capsid protein